MGFSQESLIKYELDLTDALIMRWFVDFKDTGKMYYEIIHNDKYYWIKYEALLKDIPVIGIKKVALGRRLKKLSEKNILKQYIKKQGGIFTMYSLGVKYIEFIDSNFKTSKFESVDLCTSKFKGSKLESSKGIDLKVQTNNYSIKKTNLQNNNIYENIFNYYLSKNLIKHKSLNDPMKKSIDRAIKQYSLNEQDLKNIIDRHALKVEETKDNGKYAKRKRSLSELFGQKKKDSLDLICYEYTDDIFLKKEVNESKKEEIKKFDNVKIIY
jgi:hypothetical protein